MEIGARVKKLRLAKKATLKKLARATGLTISFLSQLERNLTSPSVKSLRKIAQALQTKVAYFFEEEEIKDFVFVKNATEKHFDKRLKTFWQVLISDVLNIRMEPSLFRLRKDGKFTDRTEQDKGEEFGFVCRGKIALFRNRQKFILKKGDFIYFVSIKPKRLANVDRGESLVLWAQLKKA